MEGRSFKATMAAASPEEVQALHYFFSLLQELYTNKWGNAETPDDLEDSGFPEEWVAKAHKLYNQDRGVDEWKGLLVEWVFELNLINTGWRRVVWGFEALHKMFCILDSDTLEYDTETLVKIIEECENCIVTRTKNPE